VDSVNITTTGAYSFDHTPSSSGSYNLEFVKVVTMACMSFKVDDVIMSYTAESVVEHCEDGLAGRYRYGFGGKEKLDELHGNSGDAYDYGARIYDARLGRWMSVDPLFAKYPFQSPYAFVGNSPILHQEFGGKDYGVYINHADKTIIIKATYYTPVGDKESHDEAVRSTEFWNSQSNKYQYRVEDANGNYTFYDIKFEFGTEELPEGKIVEKTTVQEVDFESGASKIRTDKVGGQESNLFDVKTDNDIFFTEGSNSARETENRGGLTKNETNIGVKKSQKGGNAGRHEVGHSIATGHIPYTIMSKSLDMVKEVINSKLVRNILAHVGIGKPFSKNEPVNPNTGKVIEEKGKAPENFGKGTVIDK
jgi:RHS repeat-associated protein